MTTRYHEVMAHVEVTRDVRQRILGRIREEEIRREPERGNALKYLAAAACLVIVLTGLLLRYGGAEQADPPGGGLEMTRPMEAASLEELSETVGFPVAEVEGLPFSPEKTTYIAIGTVMAEIRYEGEEQTAVFRKSAGADDNSGDYNSYPAEKEITVGNMTVTLKGEGALYTLAVWSGDGYAYSLRLSEGIPEEDWVRIIAARK